MADRQALLKDMNSIIQCMEQWKVRMEREGNHLAAARLIAANLLIHTMLQEMEEEEPSTR